MCYVGFPGLVVFSIVTGIAIVACGEGGKPLLRFFQSVSVVMMKVTTWIIYLAPVGVCFLIAGQILEMKSFSETFAKLGLYFATVLVGLGVHGCIVLPLLFGKNNVDVFWGFILLTDEGSHREDYRDFQPNWTSSAGSVARVV